MLNKENEMGRLVLGRRVGEVIKIGEEVTVTVVEIKGSQVKLSFEAPKTTTIHRKEVYNKIKEGE